MKGDECFYSRRLEKNRIQEIPPKVFSHLKKLRRLYVTSSLSLYLRKSKSSSSSRDISNNLISTIYPDSFAGLKSLNSLYVYRRN